MLPAGEKIEAQLFSLLGKLGNAGHGRQRYAKLQVSHAPSLADALSFLIAPDRPQNQPVLTEKRRRHYMVDTKGGRHGVVILCPHR